MTAKTAIAMAAALLATTAPAQSSGVAIALWEIAVRIDAAEMPGMPAGIGRMMTGKTTRVRHCITPADAARGPQDMLGEQELHLHPLLDDPRHARLGNDLQAGGRCDDRNQHRPAARRLQIASA